MDIVTVKYPSCDRRLVHSLKPYEHFLSAGDPLHLKSVLLSLIYHYEDGRNYQPLEQKNQNSGKESLV
jgi:hypothetical protein